MLRLGRNKCAFEAVSIKPSAPGPDSRYASATSTGQPGAKAKNDFNDKKTFIEMSRLRMNRQPFFVKSGSDGNEHRFAFFFRDENGNLIKMLKIKKRFFFSVAEGRM